MEQDEGAETAQEEVTGKVMPPRQERPGSEATDATTSPYRRIFRPALSKGLLGPNIPEQVYGQIFGPALSKGVIGPVLSKGLLGPTSSQKVYGQIFGPALSKGIIGPVLSKGLLGPTSSQKVYGQMLGNRSIVGSEAMAGMAGRVASLALARGVGTSGSLRAEVFRPTFVALESITPLEDSLVSDSAFVQLTPTDRYAARLITQILSTTILCLVMAGWALSPNEVMKLAMAIAGAVTLVMPTPNLNAWQLAGKAFDAVWPDDDSEAS